MPFFSNKKGSIYFVLALLLCINFSLKSSFSFAQETRSRSAPVDTARVGEKRLPSPKGAMIRSLFFPGWGQWYNGKKIKSVLVFLTETGIIASSFYWQNLARGTDDPVQKGVYIDNRNLAYWYLGGAILLSMADAYVDAHLAGFDVSPDLEVAKQNYKISVKLVYNF